MPFCFNSQGDSYHKKEHQCRKGNYFFIFYLIIIHYWSDILKMIVCLWQTKPEQRGVQAMSQEFDTPLWSHLLTARAFNFTAHTHTHTNTHACVHACCPLLRLPDLLSVESSPILPCMHYLVFFFELLKFSTVPPHTHSGSLSALYSKFVPFTLTTVSE